MKGEKIEQQEQAAKKAEEQNAAASEDKDLIDAVSGRIRIERTPMQ